MMTIQQIYDQAIKNAVKADLRGAKAVNDKLKKLNEKYNKLQGDAKKEFDKESLINPYADSRIFTKNTDKPVKKIMAGIDIDTGEVLLAQQLGVDLIISHHPIGSALAGLGEVMNMQTEILSSAGIPINVAQNLMKVRISEVGRSVGSANHFKVIDAARLVKIPIMCTHTFADNLVARFIYNLVKKKGKSLETVGDVIKLLKEIPEYAQATQQKAGPKIFTGHKDNYAGKIIISEMTGGTSGSKKIYSKLAQAGVGTIIGMHMHEEWKKQAEKHHINVIIAGHMSSDSIGMNLLLDELEKKKVEVIPCSGLIRYSRNKKTTKK